MELNEMFSLKKVVFFVFLHHSCCILHPDNPVKKKQWFVLIVLARIWVSNDGQRG